MAREGQQPKDPSPLGKVIAPAHSMGLTSPAVPPAQGSMMRQGVSAGVPLPNSPFATPGKTYLATGDHPRALAIGMSTVAGVGVATRG